MASWVKISPLIAQVSCPQRSILLQRGRNAFSRLDCSSEAANFSSCVAHSSSYVNQLTKQNPNPGGILASLQQCRAARTSSTCRSSSTISAWAAISKLWTRFELLIYFAHCSTTVLLIPSSRVQTIRCQSTPFSTCTNPQSSSPMFPYHPGVPHSPSKEIFAGLCPCFRICCSEKKGVREGRGWEKNPPTIDPTFRESSIP